jgi:hypothetical protein
MGGFRDRAKERAQAVEFTEAWARACIFAVTESVETDRGFLESNGLEVDVSETAVHVSKKTDTLMKSEDLGFSIPLAQAVSVEVTDDKEVKLSSSNSGNEPEIFESGHDIDEIVSAFELEVVEYFDLRD